MHLNTTQPPQPGTLFSAEEKAYEFLLRFLSPVAAMEMRLK